VFRNSDNVLSSSANAGQNDRVSLPQVLRQSFALHEQLLEFLPVLLLT